MEPSCCYEPILSGMLAPLWQGFVPSSLFSDSCVFQDGRPMFLLRLGLLDMKGLLRSCGVENIVKLTLSICEEGLIKAAEVTKMLGVPIR